MKDEETSPSTEVPTGATARCSSWALSAYSGQKLILIAGLLQEAP